MLETINANDITTMMTYFEIGLPLYLELCRDFYTNSCSFVSPSLLSKCLFLSHLSSGTLPPRPTKSSLLSSLWFASLSLIFT